MVSKILAGDSRILLYHAGRQICRCQIHSMRSVDKNEVRERSCVHHLEAAIV